MKIIHGQVFNKTGTFQKKDIYIKNGRIVPCDPLEGETIDAEGLYVLPGFVDIHTHGASGHDFCDADTEGLVKIARYEKAHGITSFCPTSMTFGEDRLRAVFATAAAFSWSASTARIAGINMEGPFISSAKKGAQKEVYIHEPDAEMFQRLQRECGNMIRLVTIAPELPSADDFIQKNKENCVISIGHSQADYETASKAMQAGAHHVTHLFNAMPPFHHREPGIIGAAEDHTEVMVEVICDGLHIHPAMIRSIYRMFGRDRIILISDSMEATGMPDGHYKLGDQQVTKIERKAILADGTLAGSCSNLFDCFRNAVAFGIPFADAIRMVTINPARSIDMAEQIGVIQTDAFADIVLMDKNLEIVRVI